MTKRSRSVYRTYGQVVIGSGPDSITRITLERDAEHEATFREANEYIGKRCPVYCLHVESWVNGTWVLDEIESWASPTVSPEEMLKEACGTLTVYPDPEKTVA